MNSVIFTNVATNMERRKYIVASNKSKIYLIFYYNNNGYNVEV